MSRQRLNGVLLPSAFLFLLIAAPAAAAPAFKLRSVADEPQGARDGLVVATVASAPVDGSVNSLYDGVDRYFTVENTDGDPVQISVGKNALLGTVRLSFDDGIEDSADVDISRSRVMLSPATIPADRASTATVVVKPMDGSGVPLGAGLDLSLDQDALFPGVLVGAFVDNMDGSYTATIIGLESGQGTVAVSVEKQALEVRPVVSFEFVSLSSDQQDLLQTIDELQVDIDGLSDPDQADRLTQAVEKLQDSVSALSETPPDRVDALDKIKQGMEKIEDAMAEGLNAATAEGYMASVANVARALAEQAISIAISLGGHAPAIDDALVALDNGDAHLSRSDHVEAAKAYEDAAAIAAGALDRTVDSIVKNTGSAIGEIGAAADEGFNPEQADGYMARLATIARQLAVIAIDGANAAHGEPTSIAQALDRLIEGDGRLADSDYEKAAGKYEDAARAADDAAPGSTYDVASLSAPRSTLAQLFAELQAAFDADPAGQAADKLSKAIEDLEDALAALP